MGIQSPEDQLQAMKEADLETLDNPTVAGRMDGHPPPQACGMAPLGEYIVFNDITPLNDFPVASAFKSAMPAPAPIPAIAQHAKSAFNLSGAEPTEHTPGLNRTFGVS